MQAFKTLYRFFKGLLILVAPIILVIFSITTNLTNASLHKNTLKNSNFYTSLSNEIKNTSGNIDPTKGINSILAFIALQDLATPGWLQNFSEKNIDLTTDWLNGTNKDLSFYLPVQEVETEIYGKLDSRTKELNEEFKNRIATCSDSLAKDIKTQGYDSKKDFCLPREVKENKQKLTEYLGYNKDSGEGILNSLIKNNYLTSFNNYFKVPDNIETKDINQSLITSNTNKLRDFFVTTKFYSPYAVAGLVALLILVIALAFAIRPQPLKEIIDIFWLISTSTLIICGAIILAIGGTSYLSSSIQNTILGSYGFNTNKIIDLVNLEVLKFSFNITSIALAIAACILIINILLLILKRLQFDSKTKSKNNGIKNRSINQTKNPTLNGEFERMRSQNNYQQNNPNNNFNQNMGPGAQPPYNSQPQNFQQNYPSNQPQLNNPYNPNINRPGEFIPIQNTNQNSFNPQYNNPEQNPNPRPNNRPQRNTYIDPNYPQNDPAVNSRIRPPAYKAPNPNPNDQPTVYSDTNN